MNAINNKLTDMLNAELKPYMPESLVISKSPCWRIALLGAPGTGKTTSCLTFPNRIWLDFDNKLPTNEQSLPFWNAEFCDSIAKRTMGNRPNARDAFLIWLRNNHALFTANQTVILDSWTLMINAFDRQTNAEEAMLKVQNNFYAYGKKLQYCKEICDYLRGMKATVVVTMHESPDRDADGDLNGKIRPLMDGQFKDQLLGHFTDAWRQRANIHERELSGAIKRTDGRKTLKTIAHNNNPNWVWFWQILGDTEFDTNCNPELGKHVRKLNMNLIPADFNEVLKIISLGTNV